MDLTQFSPPTFGLRLEGNQLKWPPEFGAEPSGWRDTVFLSYDQYPFCVPDKWNELCITEAGELYVEYSDLSLVEDNTSPVGYKAECAKMNLLKLDSFTGSICFETYVASDIGEDDYFLVGNITFYRGKLDEVVLSIKNRIDNSSRKSSLLEQQRSLNKTIKRQEAKWFPAYLIYKKILEVVLQTISAIWYTPIWLLKKIFKFLTPF